MNLNIMTPWSALATENRGAADGRDRRGEGRGRVMLTFDDFLVGLDQFGQRIQPLMKTRANVRITA